ncbi:MAG: gamma carbonic anhydrase family protein [Candidatus Desulfofervidaceae bacterium]|nr:gamma carbonic anhydrase family protein [Candidatus Desulfofervidaceae bacterium]
MILPYLGKIPQIHPTAFIVESADIIGDVTIGAKSSVWFKAVVRGDVHYIRIGERTNVQDGALLHVTHDTHPLIIGNEVTIGHGVILHGCTVKDRVLIGMGAIVLDGAILNEECIVGAGALVPPNMVVPQRTLVVGVPAKVKRELNEAEIEYIKQAAKNYIQYTENYLKSGVKNANTS